jgi:subtilisin family serine protease
VGQNFTYSIKVKNLDNKPIYVIPISRESFDPPDSVNIVKDYRPFISVLPEKLDPGEVATVGPHAFFSARRAGEVRITVYVSWSYSEEGLMYEASETFSFGIVIDLFILPEITFLTEPPDVGSITFSGTTYTNGQSGEYTAGTYQIEANVPKGYIFYNWVTTGGVSVANSESQQTIASVTGSGSLIAVFKWFVKLRGTVISHVQYPSGWPAVVVKVEELLLDTSNRLKIGEVVEVYRETPFTEISDGDRVEVYGLGFWIGNPPGGPYVEHGIVIKSLEHYVKKIEGKLEVDVKFSGTVILVSPDYVDWKIKIEEIFLDPTGELKVGEEIFVMAHNETFPNTGKPWVIGEPNVGDHVEVYGEYLSEPTPHVWAHKSYHYIKKIAGESTVLLIGKVLSHNINEEYTTIRVEKLLNCTKLNRIYLKVKDYETNFVEVSNSKCSWEREVEGKEVIVKWDKYYNEFYKISSIPPGTIIEFLGKLLKTGNEIYGQLKISDSIDYFIIPGVYFMVYIKSFTVNHDFDSWDKNYAANVYFKVNVKGVDDDADGSIDEDGEYVRLPTNTDMFRRWMGSVAWEILVHDNELGREIVGPKISDARSNIPYFPVPISIDIEVMDEDPGLDDLMARFPFRISEEELRRNDYKLCLARDSEDGKVRIELCLEPLLLRETGLLHNKQDTLDLELNFKDIKSIEAFNEFNNKRFEEVSLAIIEWDYPDVSIEWQVGRVDIWDCSNGGCEYVLPSVCQVGGKRDYADHASMTSGIIISRIDGKGPAGLGWNTRLMIIKASRNTLGKAIRLAVDEGAKVISLSIGTLEEDPELMPAVAYAINDNVVIVSAAGNDFTSRIDVLNKFKSIIKVAGVTRFVSSINQPKRLEWWWTGAFFSSAPYSNYGKFPTFNLDMELRIDFSSLSTIFNTTSIGCQYQLGAGTSSAAPTLASIVALIQGYAKAKYGRYLTINEVYEVLRQASIDLGEPGWDPYYGWGLVNVKKALEVVEKGIPTPIYDITELPKPKSGTLIRMSSNGSQLLLHVVDNRGRILFGFSKNFAEIIAEKGVEHTVTENFTEVFLPFTSGMFRVLIDAGYSHQEVERVNLTIMTIKDDLLLAEWRASSLIERGKILSYNMRLDVERGVNVKEGINSDVNMDGVVDYKDLAMFAASYGRMENELEFNANADFNRDGIIDYKDLAILAANYGGRSS